jgi:CheY-like chemotaxis protein
MQSRVSHKKEPKQTRILVVEDVINVATVLKTRLEAYGYVVCDVATTGAKAIAGAIEHQPDLILMDILLKGKMNGIEAAERIRSRFDIPIIYLSCLNDQKILDRAIKTKPYGFILKPYDNEELRFSIENALIKHREDRARKAHIAELEQAQSSLTSS